MLRIITENNIKTAVSVTPSDSNVLSEKATNTLVAGAKSYADGLQLMESDPEKIIIGAVITNYPNMDSIKFATNYTREDIIGNNVDLCIMFDGDADVYYYPVTIRAFANNQITVQMYDSSDYDWVNGANSIVAERYIELQPRQIVYPTGGKKIPLNSISENETIIIEQQNSIFLYGHEAVWVRGMLYVDNGAVMYDKLIKDVVVTAKTKKGVISIPAKIVYPGAQTYNGSIPNGFYIIDETGMFNPMLDMEWIRIKYNISDATEYQFSSERGIYGENVISDHEANGAWHAATVKTVFLKAYTDFNKSYYDTVLDALTNYNSLSAQYTAKYMEVKNANMLLRPVSNGAYTESVTGIPGILVVGAHYENGFVRHDITSGAGVFLPNAIAVGARINNTTTQAGTSYGFGMEFFEDLSAAALDPVYPAADIPSALSEVETANGGLTVIGSMDFTQYISVGQQLTIINGNVSETRTVAEILSVNSYRVTEAYTPVSGSGVYVWRMIKLSEFIGGQQQSYAVSIVAAKLKKIKIESGVGVSWTIVRKAARATASNNGVWDMYRGFGIINVAAAIAWIKTNYTENADFIAKLTDTLEDKNSLYRFLSIDQIGDYSPLPKHIINSLIQDLADRITALENA